MALPEKALSELAEVKAAFDKAYEEYKHKVPTKICGPNLVGVLNSAGFYKKEPDMSRDKEYDEYCKKAGIANRNRTESYDINTDTLNSPTPSDYENMAERRTKALEESMKQTISESEYKKNRAAYIEYLLMCVRMGDWHGVSDAANDLRVLEAREKPGG